MSNGLEATRYVGPKGVKPLAPTAQRRFLHPGWGLLIHDGILYDLCLMTSVGNQERREFVVNLATRLAAQSADDEHILLTTAANPRPLSAPNDPKIPLATGTEAKRSPRTPNKKHPLEGFQ